MRFIVDAQLPPALAEWLGARGHEAEHVCDLFQLNATDDAIWSLARTHSRVIVTKDRDFALWAADRRDGPQVVWIRLGNASRDTLFAWLEPRRPRILASLGEGVHLVEVRP